MSDLYSVLGVSKSASQADIKKRYRKLAGELHPDRNPGSEQRFKDVTNAYEVLSDQEKRKLYDEFGEVSLRPGFDAAQARAARNFGGFSGGGGGGQRVHFDLNDLFGGGRGGRGAPQGGIGDLFGDMFGGGRGPRGRPTAQKGHDSTSTVKISFVDAVKGTTLKLTPRTGGEPITVRIPPGATDGGRVRVRGKGGPGAAGGPSGDLLLSLEVEEHPFFTRRGDDLELELPITIIEAFRGAQIVVPTPHGDVKLTVPPGTQSGQKVRLRGKGVHRKGSKEGDLYVRFLVHYPAVPGEGGGPEEIEEAMQTLGRHVGDPRAELRF